MFFRTLTVGVALTATTLAACNVDSVTQDLTNAAIQTAFDGVKQTAEQNGGGAALIQGGAAVTLKVDNAASPINGAIVVVPAGAIPAGVDNAVVAIQGGGVSSLSESPVLVGPSALVVLRKLPGLEDITPAKPLTLSLPYFAAGGTYPVEQVSLGAFNAGDQTNPISAVTGSKADEGKKLVTGDVSDLKLPFAGIWQVSFAGGAAKPGSIIYSVTKADGTTCAGYRADPETPSPQLGLEYPVLVLDMVVGNINPAMITSTLTNPLPVPVAATTFALDNTATTFTCNGEVFTTLGATTITKLEAVFTGYKDTQAIPTAQTCNLWSSTYCYTHHGQVNFTMELDYVTAAGDHVLVSANKDLADLLWINIDNTVTP